MSIRQVSGETTSSPGFYYSVAASDSSGITDFAYQKVSGDTGSNVTLFRGTLDASGNPIVAPTPAEHYHVPGTDPNTHAIFDNQYSAFELGTGVHALFFTKPAYPSYGPTDQTALKLQEFDDSGNKIGGLQNLTLGGTSSTTDLYGVSESSGADFGSTFVVAYSTFDPATKKAQISYERFDDSGQDLGGGLLHGFNDGTHHGLDFGTFYSSINPNANGSPDFLLQYRLPTGATSGVRAVLESPDMQSELGAKTILDFGPDGEASTSVDRYNYLRPGFAPSANYAVLSQTFQYQDSSGVNHEEIALEKVNPVTLKVQAQTQFEDANGNQTGVSMAHLSNGDFVAAYNDGGQTFLKEFNKQLVQIGQTQALPDDNYGYDSLTSLPNGQFEVFWRQLTSAYDSSKPVQQTVEHSAVFGAGHANFASPHEALQAQHPLKHA